MIIRAFKFALKSILLLGLIAAGVLVYFTYPRSLRYDIVFNRPADLRPGAPVRLGDYQIGKVDRVEILEDGRAKVTVSIDPEFQGKVRSNSTAVVDEEESRREEKGVTVHNLDSTSPPISPGAEVEGTDTSLQLQLKLAEEKAKEWFIALSQKLDEIMDRLPELRDAEDVERFRARASEIAESMRELVQAHYAKFQEEYPAVREQLQRMYQRAKEIGEEHLSQILEKIMEILTLPHATPTPVGSTGKAGT